MEFIYVWALMAMAIAFIALNIWLIMDSLFNRVDEARARKPKVAKIKAKAGTGLSPVGS